MYNTHPMSAKSAILLSATVGLIIGYGVTLHMDILHMLICTTLSIIVVSCIGYYANRKDVELYNKKTEAK